MKLRDLTSKQVLIGACVIALIVALLAALPASAQGIVDGINTAAQNNAMPILDLLIKAAVFVVSAILAFATSKLPAKWRREADDARLAAEEKLRKSLHQAADTGVAEGLRQGLSGVPLVIFALQHTVKSVPDAIVGLTPTPAEVMQGVPDAVMRQLPDGVRSVLERIIGAKIAERADPLADALRKTGAMRLMPETAEAPAARPNAPA